MQNLNNYFMNVKRITKNVPFILNNTFIKYIVDTI